MTRIAPRAPIRAEVARLLAALAVYFGGRAFVEGSPSRSVRNAERLLDLEMFLGIDVEMTLQQLANDSGFIRELGNLSYVWLHWPLLLGVLGYLLFFHTDRYRQLRNALFLSGSFGLVLFAVFPMAPPRFMPGFVGTVSDDARRHYLDYPLSWANEYAAFPSFHVGWTLIACLALSGSLGSLRSRLLALVPAGLVGISVITTGNHYVLDSVAGGLIALAAYVGVTRLTSNGQQPSGASTRHGARRRASSVGAASVTP